MAENTSKIRLPSSKGSSLTPRCPSTRSVGQRSKQRRPQSSRFLSVNDKSASANSVVKSPRYSPRLSPRLKSKNTYKSLRSINNGNETGTDNGKSGLVGQTAIYYDDGNTDLLNIELKSLKCELEQRDKKIIELRKQVRDLRNSKEELRATNHLKQIKLDAQENQLKSSLKRNKEYEDNQILILKAQLTRLKKENNQLRKDKNMLQKNQKKMLIFESKLHKFNIKLNANCNDDLKNNKNNINCNKNKNKNKNKSPNKSQHKYENENKNKNKNKNKSTAVRSERSLSITKTKSVTTVESTNKSKTKDGKKKLYKRKKSKSLRINKIDIVSDLITIDHDNDVINNDGNCGDNDDDGVIDGYVSKTEEMLNVLLLKLEEQSNEIELLQSKLNDSKQSMKDLKCCVEKYGDSINDNNNEDNKDDAGDNDGEVNLRKQIENIIKKYCQQKLDCDKSQTEILRLKQTIIGLEKQIDDLVQSNADNDNSSSNNNDNNSCDSNNKCNINGRSLKKQMSSITSRSDLLAFELIKFKKKFEIETKNYLTFKSKMQQELDKTMLKLNNCKIEKSKLQNKINTLILNCNCNCNGSTS